MGTGSETFTSERARRRWSEPPKSSEDSLQREWTSVSKTRLVFCLSAIAVVPHILWFVPVLALDLAPPREFLISSIFRIGVTACWFVGPGMLFLLWIGRRKRLVSRFNCLALCTTLAFFVPSLFGLIGSSTAPVMTITQGLYLVLAEVVLGLVFSLYGLLGGWMLWRIAIRPAARPLEEITEIF